MAKPTPSKKWPWVALAVVVLVGAWVAAVNTQREDPRTPEQERAWRLESERSLWEAQQRARQELQEREQWRQQWDREAAADAGTSPAPARSVYIYRGR